MMPEMTRLLLNGPPTMAVGTPHLALRDFSFERADRVFVEGHCHDACALGADVIELEENQLSCSAVDTAR
jgi:hypothetical protein